MPRFHVNPYSEAIINDNDGTQLTKLTTYVK